MSQGDNLTGKKTLYRGIEFRSILETKVACFLDNLNIKWMYEPKTFFLSSGIPYIPDFYLPELETWLEVKGVIEPHNEEISRTFVKDEGTELLMISYSEHRWFSSKDLMADEDKDVYIGLCSNCHKYFFCCNLGNYKCRACGNHEGDHDILGILDDIVFNFGNFSDIEEGLQQIKSRRHI